MSVSCPAAVSFAMISIWRSTCPAPSRTWRCTILNSVSPIIRATIRAYARVLQGPSLAVLGGSQAVAVRALRPGGTP